MAFDPNKTMTLMSNVIVAGDSLSRSVRIFVNNTKALAAEDATLARHIETLALALANYDSLVNVKL